MIQIAAPAHAARLVKHFVRIVSNEHEALLVCNLARSTRSIWRMKSVLDELKSMSGDQRRVLIPLLNSQNIWVRFRAAQAILALEPDLARRAIESVANSNMQPEAAEAGSTLFALDSGIFIPT